MAHKGKPPIVEVEWLDAASKYETFAIREAPEKVLLIKRQSVGYLVVRDKERLLMAHTFDPAADEDDLDEGSDWTVIPRSWIVRVTELVPSETTSSSTG